MRSGFNPWVGKTPWRRERLLQYSGLENSMDCIVHGVAKSQTRLSDFHFQKTQVVTNTMGWLVKKLLQSKCLEARWPSSVETAQQNRKLDEMLLKIPSKLNNLWPFISLWNQWQRLRLQSRDLRKKFKINLKQPSATPDHQDIFFQRGKATCPQPSPQPLHVRQGQHRGQGGVGARRPLPRGEGGDPSDSTTPVQGPHSGSTSWWLCSC